MLIANGFAHSVPGRDGANFHEDPTLKLTGASDWRPRRNGEHVIGIVLHTRMGLPVKVLPGKGPNRRWERRVAQNWSADDRAASAHISVDADGSYACHADLARIATYHANHVNGYTVGIEMYQDAEGGVHEATMECAADIVDVLTRIFGVQRQFPTETAICRRLANIVSTEPRTYIAGANRGRDFCGIYGHRNVTRNRGPGDPGDPIWGVLKTRGYEPYAIDTGADIDAWSQRQRELGLPAHDVDGVPEQHTRRLIALARGNPTGLWVHRPGDDEWTHEAAE